MGVEWVFLFFVWFPLSIILEDERLRQSIVLKLKKCAF